MLPLAAAACPCTDTASAARRRAPTRLSDCGGSSRSGLGPRSGYLAKVPGPGVWRTPPQRPTVSDMIIVPVLGTIGDNIPQTISLFMNYLGIRYIPGAQMPDDSWTASTNLTLGVFIRAEQAEMARPCELVVELVADNGEPAYLMPGPEHEAEPARFTYPVTFPRQPGRPADRPRWTRVADTWGPGHFWLPGPDRVYEWRCSIGDDHAFYDFEVVRPPKPQQTLRPIAGLPGGLSN